MSYTPTVYTNGTTPAINATNLNKAENAIVANDTNLTNHITDGTKHVTKDGVLQTGLNSDKLDGYDAGNTSGNIPVSNGILNSNLNADMVDGYNLPTTPTIPEANKIAVYDGTGKIPAAALTSVSNSSAGMYINTSQSIAGSATFTTNIALGLSASHGHAISKATGTSASGTCIFTKTSSDATGFGTNGATSFGSNKGNDGYVLPVPLGGASIQLFDVYISGTNLSLTFKNTSGSSNTMALQNFIWEAYL